MKSLARADQEALRALVPSRPANKNEKCSECGWPLDVDGIAFHSGDGQFGYCSPHCLSIAEGVAS